CSASMVRLTRQQIAMGAKARSANPARATAYRNSTAAFRIIDLMIATKTVITAPTQTKWSIVQPAASQRAAGVMASLLSSYGSAPEPPPAHHLHRAAGGSQLCPGR